MSAANPNHYDTLGLSTSASPEDVRRRYRELARRYHPDVARTPDAGRRFAEINEAHSVLSDPSKRATYDANLRLRQVRTPAAAYAPAGASNQPGAPGQSAGSDRSAQPPRSAPQTAAPSSTSQLRPGASQRAAELNAKVASLLAEA